jgi:predicted RNase H-like nuclease (RuvC/YqgF family)
MSANPGGGDYVPETDARGMDNQGTELDRLRAQVERLSAELAERTDEAKEFFDRSRAARQRADSAEAKVARVEALAEQWDGLADSNEDTHPREARLTRMSASELRAALEGPSDATEPAPGTPGGSGASEGRREAHSDEVERLRAEVERLRKLCLPLKAEVARLTGYGERAIEAEAAAVRQLEAEVEQWRARALTAEADAALLSDKLAARAALRHQLDPTRGSEEGA